MSRLRHFRCLRRRHILTGLLTVLLAAPCLAWPAACVVTDRAHPVRGAGNVRVIALDAPAEREAALSAHLPADPAQAAATMRQRLRDATPAAHRQFAEAYQGVVDAWSVGVERVPAVVVDGYVVYGDADVPHAQARIAQFRRDHP